jgi:hypothetical protein
VVIVYRAAGRLAASFGFQGNAREVSGARRQGGEIGGGIRDGIGGIGGEIGGIGATGAIGEGGPGGGNGPGHGVALVAAAAP